MWLQIIIIFVLVDYALNLFQKLSKK